MADGSGALTRFNRRPERSPYKFNRARDDLARSAVGTQDIEAVPPDWVVHELDTEIGRQRLSDKPIDRPIQPGGVEFGAGNEY